MIGILLIGDELLSAQIEDQNLSYALHHFALSGTIVSEVRFVRDEQNAIAEAVAQLSESCETVITSGGVGPTHDDCTLAGVAAAFNTQLERNAMLEKSLRDFYKENITDAALTMADIPKNAELVDKKGDNWPIIRMKNCYILPGVPQIFKQKFDRLVAYLPASSPYFVARIFVKSDEVYFAEKLRQIAAQFPQVEVGSYPIFGNPKYTGQITLKHRDKGNLELVFEALIHFFTQQNSLVEHAAPTPFKPLG